LGKAGEHKELSALIRLLDDPDSSVFDKIRDKIYSYGSLAIPVLEDAWENSFDNTIQQRIENIIHSLQMDDLYRELHTWTHMGASDLLMGHLLISRHQYPDLDEAKIREQVMQIKHDVWLEINNNLTSLEKIKVLNHIMYDVHGFTSNNANELIEKDQKAVDEQDILFYINPFNKGAVFTRREIDLFIKQLNISPDKSHFLPCNNITIIKRLINNLIFAYDKTGYPDKINMLKWLKKALG